MLWKNFWNNNKIFTWCYDFKELYVNCIKYWIKFQTNYKYDIKDKMIILIIYILISVFKKYTLLTKNNNYILNSHVKQLQAFINLFNYNILIILHFLKVKIQHQVHFYCEINFIYFTIKLVKKFYSNYFANQISEQAILLINYITSL